LRQDRLQLLRDAYRCDKTYRDYRTLLKDSEVDAVFVATPAPLHATMAIEALNAGKHVVSAVPAGLSVEELEQLLETVRRTGLKYMMAETSRFRPEILSCVAWSKAGAFGTIHYAEAEYHHAGSIQYAYGDAFGCQTCQLGKRTATQDAKKVPTWSRGYPPMLYITHCTGMIVPVMRERLTEVMAVGWGDGHEALKSNYYKNNPFWNTTAFFKTSEGHSARVSVAWHIAAGGCERGTFYGDRMSFIMRRPEKSPNTVVRQVETPGSEYGIYQGDCRSEAFEQPDHRQLLPEVLRKVKEGHGGSHAFITDGFVRAIIEDQQPEVNIWEAIAYTMPGVVAHQSALRGGELLKIRDYGRAPGNSSR
jgi:hypothetical protein